MPGANVQDIQPLADLQRALASFEVVARDAATRLEREVQQMLDWLRERELHWHRQVARRQAEVDEAQTALSRCRQGNEHRDCNDEERALGVAQHRLRQAEEEVANTRRWKSHAEEAVHVYERQARHFREVVTVRTEEAKAFLERRRVDLERYIQTQGPRAALAPNVAADAGGTVGDPMGLARYARPQKHDSSCAIVAQGCLIELFTNKPFDEERLMDQAIKEGWFIREGSEAGTPPDKLGRLLELHGVGYRSLRGASIDNLKEALADGKGVLVAVNVMPLWGQDGGHALWVTGLDLDKGLVYCNDSGSRDSSNKWDGASKPYSLADFEEAWDVSMRRAIVTDEPVPVSKWI